MGRAGKPSELGRDEFVARFGHVFEHSPWIAEAAWHERPFRSLSELHGAMERAVNAATGERKMELILAHPDLAGKAAVAGELTPESEREQASAGLDQLSEAELAEFTRLNEAYTSRFGFPFIMAIKGRSKAEILAAFEQRLGNDAQTELATALDQVERIALLRLHDLLP